MWLSIGFMGSDSLRADSNEPFIYATELKGERVIVSVHVPAGHMSTVLEISNDVASGWQPVVAGGLTGEEGLVRFTFPDNQPMRFMRVQAGPAVELPKAPFTGERYFSVEPGFYQFPEHEDAKVPPFGLSPVWSLGQASCSATTSRPWIGCMSKRGKPGAISREPSSRQGTGGR